MSETETESVLVTRRDPNEEGEWETGCHGQRANNMALICSSNYNLYVIANNLFKMWDRAMKAWTKKMGASAMPRPFRQEALAWLLQNCGDLYNGVIREDKICCAPEDWVDPTPDEIRDWYCWLYRHFSYLKQDQQHVR